jgi:hypothetical protein
MHPRILRRIRQFHLWCGMFFAPAILFFAFSGALQTFDFHETEQGIAPPQWIAVMAAIHKKQDFPKARKPRPPASTGAAKGDVGGGSSAVATRWPWPLKTFVGFMSIGLIISTMLGITIALNNRQTRRTAQIMLGAGTGLPLLLLLV